MSKYVLDIKTNLALSIEVEAPSAMEAAFVAGDFAGANGDPDPQALALLHRKVDDRNFELWADGTCDAEVFCIDERLVLDEARVRECLMDDSRPERKVRVSRRSEPAGEGRHLVEISVLVYATTEVDAASKDEARDIMRGLLDSGRFEELVAAQLHRNIDGGTYDEYPEDAIDLSTGEFVALEDGIEGGEWIEEAMGFEPDTVLVGGETARAMS